MRDVKGVGKGKSYRSIESINSGIEEQLRCGYKVDENGCWIWQGQLSFRGYGIVAKWLPRSKYGHRAHVASYQMHKGPVPEGVYVCHHCDVKGCINPEHLWLGTNMENQIDASMKGTSNRYWTEEKKLAQKIKYSGSGNPMYGKSGELAPCYGRAGAKHPMFGKTQSEEAKKKISESLKRTFALKRKGVK